MSTRRAAPSTGTAQTRVRAAVRSRLRHFYRRNGYARWPLADRLEHEGYALYKKGPELRLVAKTPEELELMRGLLVEAGFQPGRPFTKGRQFGQPLYGREEVARFLALVAQPGPRHRRRSGG